MSRIGFFIWSWNSVDYLPASLKTFRDTAHDCYLFGIANAPTDNSDFYLDCYCDYVVHTSVHLSIVECVNIGYEHLYKKGCDYLGFIHPDQRFFQYDWVQVLTKTLDTYPQIGKISCSNTRLGDAIENVIYPGSEAANLIRIETWENVGPWDPNYIGCGGYDDWDYQKKLIDKGLASAITPGALMWHKGMTTRAKRPHDETHAQAMHNGTYYNNKWNTWNPAYGPDTWQDLPVVR